MRCRTGLHRAITAASRSNSSSVGVAVSLIVDPNDVSIFVIRPGQPLRVLRGDDRIDLDDVLPGLELTVAELFASVVDDWLIESDE
jgi:Uma2 family endonuclease